MIFAALRWVVNVTAFEEASRDGETEVGAKSVDDHGTTNICHVEDIKQNPGVQLKYG